ncbi:MAG: sugar porter family MFS transporter [Roseibium sp.]|uniref:sugar porter family MFS transporter n=1 Tax=Roseibium sp. TaxID=1936156 RepID=UPI001B1A63B8|nr:sugar porter family MFS transporter [Roseibium sp.]MBO6891243.1 sugar porter family MFS transporter [Roseibium sp.]MBO6931791.1 sugar porter family MFS transporter [Roseibium sp.]
MLILLAVLAAMFGFLFGTDIGVISGALPFLKKEFVFTAQSEGFMTGAVPFGAIFGAVVALLTVDRFGRRPVLIFSSILFAAGSLAAALAFSVWSLTLARLIIGMAIGVSSLVAPMYLAEIAPARIRGAVVSAFQLMITIGILAAFVVDWAFSYSGSWRFMLGFSLIPACICLAGILRAPESPRWLVLAGKEKDARTVLKTVQPDISTDRVDTIVREIEDSHPSDPSEESWSRFREPRLRGLLIFSVAAFFLQQFSGINVILNYAPQILDKAGLSGIANELIATAGIGAINMLVTILSMAVVDKVGRRPLFIFGFAGAFASLAIIALLFQLDNPHLALLTLIALFAFVFFFAISLGPLPWLYMSELFPLALRGKGMAVASLSNWICNFLVVFLFPALAASLGESMTFGMFALCCAFGLWYAWSFAPETRGVSLEEIDQAIADQRTKSAAA